MKKRPAKKRLGVGNRINPWVMTRRVAVTDTKAFEAALAVADRFVIIETRDTITFRFRKRKPGPAR